jgi:HAD superfamily hydrolase (TIGR01549 family)
MVRTILFDLDDTLYDLRAHWRSCLTTALAALAGDRRAGDAALVERALARHVYIRQLSDFLRAEGIADDGAIMAAQQCYEQIWFERMALPEETAMVLSALSGRFRLGLVTNGPIWTQGEKIERFGLRRWMDVLLISEEIGVAKPDPAIFHTALNQIGAEAAEAIFVGDSPEHDLLGAARAGMRSIWMNRHGRPMTAGIPAPLATITMLRELPALLDRLL